ncbi:MAG: lipoate--protein ligase [Clostridiales bacterium]|jgi:lipoate-protein ligase A|nr:lipoate--protein ligase [Clostridiales bacterium]HQA47986.1 lipoate--protein ligase [Bacillota bacterium]
MRYIINNSTNPYFNIALEEYCLMHVDPGEDYFLLWQNEPSIIIGRNQNTLEEINQRFVKERGIKVVRRISGGGAVYHDLGNLNFTFISRVEPGRPINFSVFVNPIINVLRELGVDATLVGRNDIVAYGKKISGNAQRLYRRKFLHHGTLLFDVNIEDLAEALNVSADKIESKGIKSIRSRVGNIREFLKEDMTIDEFRERLQRRLSNDYESEEIKLPEEAILRISETARDKFASWAWTYGESPPFNYRFEKRFPGGKVGVFIHIKEGLIRECKFYGDYLGVLETEGFEAGLKGLKYDPQTVEKAMEGMDLTSYFGPITRNELLEIMFSG